jgi:hypothetical protein
MQHVSREQHTPAKEENPAQGIVHPTYAYREGNRNQRKQCQQNA